MSHKLPDGDHLLPSGATLTIAAGEPRRLTVPVGLDDFGAMSEAEDLLVAWYDFEEDVEDEREDAVLYTLARLEAQPTHRFTGDENGPRMVRLTEEDIAGGDGEHAYDGRYLCALDRGAHEEGCDDSWPPFLDNGTWRDGWTGEPLPNAKVGPLESEAQA